MSDDSEVFVYVHYSSDEFLHVCCKSFRSDHSRRRYFALIDSFMENEGMECTKCSRICWDEAPAML